MRQKWKLCCCLLAKTLKLKHFLMRFISRLQNTHQNCRGWRASPCSLLACTCVTPIVCFFRTTPSVTWTPPSRWLRSTWTSRRCSTLKVRPWDVNVTEQCRKRVLSCYADAHGDELSCSEMHDGRHGGSGLLGKFNHLHWKNECILNHFKCIYSGTSGSDLGNMTALWADVLKRVINARINHNALYASRSHFNSAYLTEVGVTSHQVCSYTQSVSDN